MLKISPPPTAFVFACGFRDVTRIGGTSGRAAGDHLPRLALPKRPGKRVARNSATAKAESHPRRHNYQCNGSCAAVPSSARKGSSCNTHCATPTTA